MRFASDSREDRDEFHKGGNLMALPKQVPAIAPVIPQKRNPPQRPADPAKRQTGEVTVGHTPNFSKSPGSREGK
jgi:hypothetical protein